MNSNFYKALFDSLLRIVLKGLQKTRITADQIQVVSSYFIINTNIKKCPFIFLVQAKCSCWLLFYAFYLALERADESRMDRSWIAWNLAEQVAWQNWIGHKQGMSDCSWIQFSDGIQLVLTDQLQKLQKFAQPDPESWKLKFTFI